MQPTSETQQPTAETQQPTAGTETDREPVLPAELTAAIEAVLMVAERPIEPRLLAQLVEASVDAVEATCATLDEHYLSLIHI